MFMCRHIMQRLSAGFSLNWVNIAYSNEELQLLVVQRLLFEEADAFVLTAAEHAVAHNHSLSQRT